MQGILTFFAAVVTLIGSLFGAHPVMNTSSTSAASTTIPVVAVQNNPTVQPTSTIVSPAPPATGSQNKQISFTINGSTGLVAVPAGSKMQFAWTGNSVQRCDVATVPFWWSVGQFPISGNKTVSAPVPNQSSYLYTIYCLTQSGQNVSSTVAVNVVPAPLATPAIFIALASSSEFPNPYQLMADSPNAAGVTHLNQNVNDFRITASPSEGVTLTSITIKVNPSIGNQISMTGLQLFGFHNSGIGETSPYGGQPDHLFGQAVTEPIVAGQSYTFTDSLPIPATAPVDLMVQAHVSEATPGTYDAPFQITNITGFGMTGGQTSFFSGTMDGQKVTVVAPPPTLAPAVSLASLPSIPTSVSAGATKMPIFAFKIDNPSATPIDIDLEAYLGNNLKSTDLSEIYWYDETGSLIATDTAPLISSWTCTTNCSYEPSGVYSLVEVINDHFFVVPANSSKVVTMKADISPSAVAGDVIAPALLDSSLKMQSTGGIVRPTGLPITGATITIK